MGLAVDHYREIRQERKKRKIPRNTWEYWFKGLWSSKNNCVGVGFTENQRFSSNWYGSQENTDYYSTCGFYFYSMLAGSNKLMLVLRACIFKSFYPQFSSSDDQMLFISQKVEKQFHHVISLLKYDWIPYSVMSVCLHQTYSFTHTASHQVQLSSQLLPCTPGSLVSIQTLEAGRICENNPLFRCASRTQFSLASIVHGVCQKVLAPTARDSLSTEMHTNCPFQRHEIGHLTSFKIMEVISHIVLDFISSTKYASRQYSMERSTSHPLPWLFLFLISLIFIIVIHLCFCFFTTHEVPPALTFNLLYIDF